MPAHVQDVKVTKKAKSGSEGKPKKTKAEGAQLLRSAYQTCCCTAQATLTSASTAAWCLN